MARNQRKMVAEFFEDEEADLKRTARLSVQESATILRERTLKQIQRNFRAGENSRGFFKAVKQYDLEARNGMGPASYVRVGVPFMVAFQEGQKISGEGNLVILLPDGERLNFRRISKGNSWQDIYRRFGNNFFTTQVPDGAVVIYRNPRDGRNYPVYKLQKTVQAPKKLSFYEMAEELGAQIVEAG